MKVQNSKVNLKSISSYLIADTSSGRKSIRSLLSQLGAAPAQIDVAETRGDAEELIRKRQPAVIFFDQALIKSDFESIAQLQDQSLPPKSPKAFFLITNKGSNCEASAAADGSVDAVLVRPFTFDQLKTQVTTVLEEKFFPKPHQQQINQGLTLLKTNQFEESLEFFKKARDLAPEVALCNYYLGHAHMKLGKVNDAKAAFEAGLKQNATHYRCLIGMIELLTEGKDYASAYTLARRLADNHPIPMKKIPDFVKLSVLNMKFEDVFEFYKLTSDMEAVDSEVSTYLAAGLVICGLYFLRHKTPNDAVQTFKKAEILAKGNIRVLTRIVIALSEAGLEAEMNAFLSRAPKEVKDSGELQTAHLQSLQKRDPSAALRTALELIDGPSPQSYVFRMAIEISIQLQRNPSSISELIERAQQKFPDLKSDWEKLRSG